MMTNVTNRRKSTWFNQLEISEQPVAFVPYQEFRLSVYERNTNNSVTKQYFYTPTLLLDHKSTTCYFNKMVQQAEVRIKIEFWNKEGHRVEYYILVRD